MSTFVHDSRFALRTLAKKPLTTLAAALSLTLGIGALTAIASVVDGLLLQPLPYAASERLVLIWEDEPQSGRRIGGASDATFLDWRHEARSFEMLSALAATSRSLTSLEVPESLFTRPVTASHFSLFGVVPALGRVFTEEEERGASRVVLLGYSVWQRHFGGDRQILGRTVELDNEPYEVIGVMPAGYYEPIEPAPVELWVPLTLDPAFRRQTRVLVYGRLAAGVDLEAARAEMAAIAAELRRLHPDAQGNREARVELAQEVLVGALRPALWMVFGAGLFLLLIVCGNVANLLLARSLARRREMALRTALGAGRATLLRQLVIENLVLVLGAAAAGVLLAHWGLARLKTLVPVQLGLPRLEGVSVDARVLLFTVAVAVAVALFFGLVPARLALGRRDLASDLAAGAVRATLGKRGHLLRGLLVVTEIALALVLLIGTGLMVQTARQLGRQEAGEDPEHLLSLRTSLRGPAYQAAEARVDFFRRAREAVAALPGVEAVGSTNVIPLGLPSPTTRFELQGRAAAAAGTEPEALVQVVTPGYLETLGVGLREGRLFTSDDRDQAPPVAIVNRAFVVRHLGGQPALGEQLVLAGAMAPREVVGVVDDVRVFASPPDPVPTIFVPHAQQPAPIMTTVIRFRTEPEAAIPSVRAALAGLDRLMPTYQVRTFAQAQAEADWQTRFSLVLLGLFAAIALVLAMVGVFAVTSWSVAERTRELAVRMAFGAQTGDVLRAVLVKSARLTGLGLLVGLGAALALGRLVESQLYGVSVSDPSTYAALVAVGALVAALASFLPALAVTRIDPTVSLREE